MSDKTQTSRSSETDEPGVGTQGAVPWEGMTSPFTFSLADAAGNVRIER